MAKKTFWEVEYDNFMGNGFVRAMEFDTTDARIRQETDDVYIFHDDKLGYSRVLYTTENAADCALMAVMQD